MRATATVFRRQHPALTDEPSLPARARLGHAALGSLRRDVEHICSGEVLKRLVCPARRASCKHGFRVLQVRLQRHWPVLQFGGVTNNALAAGVVLVANEKANPSVRLEIAAKLPCPSRRRIHAGRAGSRCRVSITHPATLNAVRKDALAAPSTKSERCVLCRRHPRPPRPPTHTRTGESTSEHAQGRARVDHLPRPIRVLQVQRINVACASQDRNAPVSCTGDQ
eukprot:SAG11_NODE_195_length_12838_cov_15.711045_3_plen_224_part_00